MREVLGLEVCGGLRVFAGALLVERPERSGSGPVPNLSFYPSTVSKSFWTRGSRARYALSMTSALPVVPGPDSGHQ